MDHAWMERAVALEAAVADAVTALLAHTRASGTMLTMQLPGESEPVYVVIGRADALDDLHPRVQESPAHWTGGQPAQDVLDQLPDAVREDVETLRGGGKH